MRPLSSLAGIADWVRGLRGRRRGRASTGLPTQVGKDAQKKDLPAPVTPGGQLILQQPLLILDLETSGLDMRRDTVLSIGAVRIEDNAIPLAGHIDAVLQVDASLKQDSQLLHGLSPQDLQQGRPAAAALRELLAYGEGCIWLAFHAGFDRRMLERALRKHLNCGFRQPIFDVAALACMLYPELEIADAALDDWAKAFGLDTSARHSAAADALLTAEITLVLLHQAERQGLRTWKQLADVLHQWRLRQDSSSGPMF